MTDLSKYFGGLLGKTASKLHEKKKPKKKEKKTEETGRRGRKAQQRKDEK